MKTLSIFKKIILENSRFEVLLDKFTKEKKNKEGKKIKPLMDLGKFAQIIFADPTTKKPDGFDETDLSIENLSKVQPGAYTNWILKKYEIPGQFNDERDDVSRDSPEFKNVLKNYRELFIEDLFKLTDDLKKFTKYKQYFPQDKRDINKFGSPDELFRFLETFQIPEKKKKDLEKKELKKEIRKEREGFKHPGASLEFEGSDYTVIKISDLGPKGQEAASWYGGFYDYDNGESRWCTSPPNSSYFKGYAKDGPLYVILANDDKGLVGKRTGLPQERYQFHFPSNQFMDRADRRIELVNFLNEKAPELKEYFKPEFAKGLTTAGGKRIEISYPDSSASKFIALYGFNDFFESLPTTIESFSFVNTSKETMSFDIPPTIGNFTNLTAMMLQNCVRSLPEEMGKLKSLHFLSLQQTPQLETIPESLANLPMLQFINLSGCPNLEIPSKFLEVYEEVKEHPGTGFYTRKS
jgi:hypothetical protein